MRTRYEIRQELNILRELLHKALDAADGDQLDPAVQRISIAFDRALNQYYSLQVTRSMSGSVQRRL